MSENKSPSRSVLVCGQSGSGKTTYARDLASNFDHVFTVNGEGLPGGKSLGYAEIAATKFPENSAVVFDDVIKPNPAQVEVLRKFLVYIKRHAAVTVAVLTHSVTTNNTFELMQHFDSIVFTKCTPNYRNFADTCRALKLEKTRCEGEWRGFLLRKKKFCYLVLTVSSGEFKVEELGVTPEEKSDEEKRSRVQGILSSMGQSDLAMQMYDHLFSNFSPSRLDYKDLSITLFLVKDSASTKRQEPKEKKFSVCDLLFYATTPETVPSEDSVRLFLVLTKEFNVPTLFLRNPKFKELAESLSTVNLHKGW